MFRAQHVKEKKKKKILFVEMGNSTTQQNLASSESFPKLHESLLSEAFLETIKSLAGESFQFVPEECFVENISTKFEIIRTLGRGSSCEVYEAKSVDGKNQPYVALKKLHLSDPKNQVRFRREVKILASLQHPNVVKFYQAYVDSKNLYIATKLCTGGDLLDRIRRFRTFTERKAASILRSLIKTIAYCHTKNIVHRDLKPGNVVFESNQRNANLMIIDFGDALKVDDNKTYHSPCYLPFSTRPFPSYVYFGTLLYLPPEIHRRRFGWEMKKSDMWSIGIIAYVLVTGKAPFMGTETHVMTQILNHREITWPEGCTLSDTCKQFIAKLLTRNTEIRMSAIQALKEPFLVQQQSSTHLGDNLLQDIGNFYDASSVILFVSIDD
ncbi:calmodulin-dependent protein kinase [Reticulomyxa filosa]|uniref:Calmodulin-dependent protein kinase n=1 Tax=Reticulomyxa filosa TaxID=46433 RepID=X6N3M3_RETFI|nr:calmodulin-dependent protein kinase [Reticulomyxa filosa]|eukprot:ETO19877.1 calmodulin-dependent protein kinase [Reticulomyxa filosa]